MKKDYYITIFYFFFTKNINILTNIILNKYIYFIYHNKNIYNYIKTFI